MNLLVCVRYSDTGQAAGQTNPFDLFAMEMAARIKDVFPCKIFALSHGTQRAAAALQDCIAIGADIACRVEGDGDSADVLSAAILEIEKQHGPVCAVFCGNQSVDGGSYYTGAAMAERLHRSFASYAIDAQCAENGLVVTRESEYGTEKVMLPYPCVVAVTKPVFDVRYPTIRSRMMANRVQPAVLPVTIKPSDAQAVRSAEPCRRQREHVIWKGAPEESASQLLQYLAERGLW